MSTATVAPDTASSVQSRDKLLPQVIQQLSLARSIAQVQEIVRHAARELTGADGATFVMRDRKDGEEYCFYADEDAISPLWKGQRFPLATCISGWAMINRRPAEIPDIYEDPRIPHDAYRPTFVKSLLMVPIRQLDPIGAIGNYWATKHSPTDDEVAVLQALADSTAVALENVRVLEELEHAHAETLRRVTLAAENERRRWARELHDETLQGLAGMRLLIDAARRRGDIDAWTRTGDEAVGLLETEIESLRALIADLRPPALDRLGLYAAIRALAEHHASRGLVVDCAFPQDEPPLGPDMDTTLYRLVQEALTNVAKHANARLATVTLTLGERTVEVEVVDDGVGIDASKPSSGFGLTGVRERAALLGGTADITPREGGGTVMRASIPLG